MCMREVRIIGRGKGRGNCLSPWSRPWALSCDTGHLPPSSGGLLDWQALLQCESTEAPMRTEGHCSFVSDRIVWKRREERV